LLRYVWLHDPDATDLTFDLGTLNAHLVYYGYAAAKDYQPDVKHSDTLHALSASEPPASGTVPIGPLKRQSGTSSTDKQGADAFDDETYTTGGSGYSN